jgi:penicillin-binding protein 2
MRRETKRYRLFTRRAAMLAGGKALLLAVVGGRLYQLQAVESEHYVTLAEDNRINLRLIAPPRGHILDRRGRVLAVNRLDYRVLLVAEQSPDVQATLAELDRLTPLREADWRRVLKEVRWKRKFVPVTVAENLSWEDVARIEVNALDLPGVSIEEGFSRDYPHGELLSHVLGYVAPVAPEDAKDDPLLELPGFRIGKAGVEKVYDLALRGAGGRSQVEVNAVGRVIRELERKEGRSGAVLTLSLDLDLQKTAFERFGDQTGAAVLMEVHSGEVLVLVSKPGFDPNIFSRGLTSQEWRSLITNSHSPLTNKAIAGQYAPGSTFKPVVALAALEKGVITPGTVIPCYGRVRLGDAVFHCWRRGGHGSLSLRQAIAQSCDCYFYEAARRVGVDAIAVMASRLGLGQPVGIDLPAERGGLMPTRDWKLATLGAPWSKGETLIAGIGQGYVLSTPLQLAVMTARIANGQLAVVPRLHRQQKTADGRVQPAASRALYGLNINSDHLQVVREGLVAVVNGPSGTAKASAIRIPGEEMAGKTGTSQVRRISRAERATRVRKNEELPWEQRDHALFVGYAPYQAPRYAVAVLVEHGGGGSKVAAPIARDILLAAQELDRPRLSPVAGKSGTAEVNDPAAGDADRRERPRGAGDAG